MLNLQNREYTSCEIKSFALNARFCSKKTNQSLLSVAKYHRSLKIAAINNSPGMLRRSNQLCEHIYSDIKFTEQALQTKASQRIKKSTKASILCGCVTNSSIRLRSVLSLGYRGGVFPILVAQL